MEDRETARKRRYGERKTTGIMMATVPHVTSGLGLRKFQADGFLLTRVYVRIERCPTGRIFIKFGIRVFFGNVPKIQVSLKTDKKASTLHEVQYTFVIISR